LADIISHDDYELNECLEIMIDISCNELYSFYLNENQINISNQIVKMIGSKKNILDEIRRRIFGVDKSGAFIPSIFPLDLMKKFNEDKLVI
jgi:hypothetical protein